MKSDSGMGSESTVPSATGASASMVPAGSTAEKHASIDEGSSMRKRSRRGTFEQLVDTSGNTTRDTSALDLVGTVEFHVKELEDEVKKTWAELEWKELELEVGVLHSSLDGAQNDRARPEGEVLSLTEATTFLKVKLKSEGPKAVAAYKASRGFELGLEKMRRVIFEFGYQVVLERL
ncbi:hypothetical protein B296_00044272 [Ensete ventricosum]|uniref:Uncharacterized protein n=1 Tax=Ensete ventricosum TaxID=4639 RepID=A0A426YD82_ENSVE|nr:hypothetical protein B296_00044272 [Ensete ventricosum]